MATPSSNPAQLAPGDEAGLRTPDTPYAGYSPGQHIGLITLNEAFWQGVDMGRDGDRSVANW